MTNKIYSAKTKENKEGAFVGQDLFNAFTESLELVNKIMKEFDLDSLSAISNRIFNNGIIAIKSMKNGVDHDGKD